MVHTIFLARHDLIHSRERARGGDVRQAIELPEVAKHSLTQTLLAQ